MLQKIWDYDWLTRINIREGVTCFLALNNLVINGVGCFYKKPALLNHLPGKRKQEKVALGIFQFTGHTLSSEGCLTEQHQNKGKGGEELPSFLENVPHDQIKRKGIRQMQGTFVR